MKTLKKIISARIITSYLVSCHPKYIPNVINVPIFEQEGNFQASINTGTSIFDAQVALFSFGLHYNISEIHKQF